MKRIIFILLFIVSLTGIEAQSIQPLKVTHGPWIQHVTNHGVTICWTTNLPAVPAILIKSDHGDEERVVRNSTDGIIDAGGTLHQVRVTGLEPGKKYSYRLQSTEILKYRPYQVYYGDVIRSRPIEFSTPDPESKEVRVLFFNDIHEKSGLLAQLFRQTQPEKADLVIYNGDMLDYFEREEQIYNSVIDTSAWYFAGSVPFVYARGNHETRGMLARELKSYFDYPSDRFYFAFTRGPIRFVVLDCGEDKPDDNQYYYGLADYDSYRLEELEWLKKEIQSDAFQGASFQVIVIHMPVHPGNGQGHGQLFLAEHFGPVLKDSGADLMISGHTHREQWMSSNESGLGFPLYINLPRNGLELRSNGTDLRLNAINEEGKVVMKQTIIKK